MTERKIAVLCDYQLLPERVGGMDYFFWKFDAKCREHNIAVDWFFPNMASHGGYDAMTIIPQTEASVEKTFQKYFKVEKPDYTHVVTHFLELCTPFFKKIKELSRAKIIAVDHNPRPLEGYPFKKRIKKRVKGHLYSKYIDVFVGVSNYTLRELIKDFGRQIESKTHIVLNGLPTHKFIKKQTYQIPRSFIVACHLRENKGIQDLLGALSLLPENIKGIIQISIFGDGPFEENLKRLTIEFNLDNRITFHGSVDDLPSQYHKFDFLIHPSHAETFCYTVLESLISGLPVITTREAGNVLKLVEEGKNGFLFEAQNVYQLALLLEQLITGEKKITRNTRTEIAERFTIEKMVEEHFKLL